MPEYKFIDNKLNRHMKINIPNLVTYIILYAVALFSYIFVCGYVHLIILVFMTIAPFVSIVMEKALLSKLAFKLVVSDKYIHKDGCIHMGLLLDNKSFFSSLDVKVNIDVENIFYKTKAPISVAMPANIRQVNKVVVPFVASLNGIVSIKVNKIEVRDLIGIVSYVFDVDMTKEVEVYPSNIHSDDIDKTGLYEGVSENEETNTKGSDLSDVSNIREYVPGDRIKDIHWKLSAKKDILLVKERVRISERQLIMLLDVCGIKEDIDMVLEYAYNIVRACLKDGIPTKLVWWNKEASELDDMQVNSYEDLKEAYGLIYRVGVNKDMDDAFEYMKMTYNKVSSFINIKVVDGTVKGVPVDNV